MNFGDVFSLAFRTVRSNKLRTGLTVAIISFGIMALVGIITAIKAMNQKFSESFSTMGANAFTVRYKERNIRFGGGGDDVKLSKKGKKKEKKSNLGKKITKDEAENFVRSYEYPAVTSISIFGNRNTVVSRGNKKTNPNVILFGGDENYLLLNGFTMAEGRNISNTDVSSGSNVVLLGYDVADKLFREGIAKAVNAQVRINNISFRVVGVMASRGSSFGFNRDNIVITSYNNVERNFPSSSSYVVAVMTQNLL